MNLYTYVHNNPLTGFDPTGHWCTPAGGGTGHSGGCNGGQAGVSVNKDMNGSHWTPDPWIAAFNKPLELPKPKADIYAGMSDAQVMQDLQGLAQNTIDQQNGNSSWMKKGLDDTAVIIATFATAGITSEVKAASTFGSKLPSLVNLLDNITYTGKVLDDMLPGAGEYHSFPLKVDQYGNYGNVFVKKGGDGIARTWVEIPGTYDGKDGVFQYIIEPNNTVNHRLFVATRK